MQAHECGRILGVVWVDFDGRQLVRVVRSVNELTPISSPWCWLPGRSNVLGRYGMLGASPQFVPRNASPLFIGRYFVKNMR
jgi:hypothetical protein